MLALVAPTVALISSNADAASYIKFDGIDGESTHVDHKDWIAVESFKWSVAQEGVVAGGSPKVVVKDFTIMHRIDKASPLLFLKCAEGKPIPSVTLVMTRVVDGTEVEYYRMTLTDVIITSIGADAPNLATGDGSVRPLEAVSMRLYPKLEIEYTPYDENGKKGTPVKSGPIVIGSATDR